MPDPTLPLDEAAARAVLLVRAADHDAEAARALWTPEDRAWASRAARLAAPAAGASPRGLVVERARHAVDRLRGRDAALARWLEAPRPSRAWLAGAVGLGALAGLLVDHIGPSQHIHLLAPPVWAVVAWNLAVLLALLLGGWRRPRTQGPRAWLQRTLARLPRAGPVPARLIARAEQDRAPLHAARAATLLHAAAAALGAGLVAGLYLRGLVLDYRVAWQSTFLEAGTVHALLAALLAPASALTGLAVPDAATVAALRVGPHQAAEGSAAIWVHLYAATVVLLVVMPRALLAALGARRSSRLARDFPVPWDDGDLRGLAHQLAGGEPHAWVLPHARALSATAARATGLVLAAACGEPVEVQFAAPVAWGREAEGLLPEPPPEATQAWIAVDAAATPEPEVHGVLIERLRGRSPERAWGLLLDEADYAARVGPARAAERRAAWQRLAEAQGLPLHAVPGTP